MTEAPSKSDREACWNARDTFWKCLELTKENFDKCKKEREVYEGNCSKTWVKHFDRRREYLRFKAKMEAGGFDKKPS